MNPMSKLQLGELLPVPRWLEIAGGVCLALIGVVMVASVVWAGW